MTPRRILVVHEYAAPIGGIERYLEVVVAQLRRAGHVVDLWTEYPSDSTVPTRPDVVFLHHASAARRQAVRDLGAPIVRMVHDYRGQCVSGRKLWMLPAARPCNRALGPGCLAHYFPHRCGGLNPVTMLRQYAVQRGEAAGLHEARRVLTLSEHMRRSVIAQGVVPERVETLPPFVLPPAPARTGTTMPFRLLFAGRHVDEKGGDLLLRALPTITRSMPASPKVTMAGDGPFRARWEALARAGGIAVRFPGHVSREAMEQLYQSHDLLVMPSRWPEPFGLAGLEAARHGMPSVAFAVGGIPEWLVDGVNGVLAREISASALARAVAQALDPARWPVLVAGALATVQRHPLRAHMAALEAALA